MEMILNNEFCEMSRKEMESINGGGLFAAFSAFLGGVLIAFTPFGCCLGGPGVGAAMFAAGCGSLDYACDNPNK